MTTTLVRPRRGRVQDAGRLNEIDDLLALNRRHSELFRSAGQSDERRFYRVEYPTEIGVSKCMDGRMNGPVLTETAMGIMQPWRNIGGKFDLSWPLYQESILAWHDYAISQKRRCLKLVTYHFSRGERERGCRGFNFDRQAAQEYTGNLKSQFDKDFGRTVLYAVHCGVETDLESWILHGDNGEIVDLADVPESSEVNIRDMLRRLFPDMHEQIVRDFIPLIRGNIRHITKIRADKHRNLAVDAEHKEWVLAFGRGFDWLHEINMALIVGPFDPNRYNVIKEAAKLIYENQESGRTNGHEIVLLSSAFYRDESGPERNLKIRKARGLEEEALYAIQEAVPDLLPHLQILTGVVNINTRVMEVLHTGRAV